MEEQLKHIVGAHPQNFLIQEGEAQQFAPLSSQVMLMDHCSTFQTVCILHCFLSFMPLLPFFLQCPPHLLSFKAKFLPLLLTSLLLSSPELPTFSSVGQPGGYLVIVCTLIPIYRLGSRENAQKQRCVNCSAPFKDSPFMCLTFIG